MAEVRVFYDRSQDIHKQCIQVSFLLILYCQLILSNV